MAKSARVQQRRSSREELPHVRGQGLPGGATSHPSEVRGGSREEQPPVQGAVAVWAQEGLEEPSHVEGQEG